MDGDVRAVTSANDAFYRAIETGDLDLMEAVLLDGRGANGVTCVHPGWPMLRGRGEVLRSFAAVMAGTPYIQFILTDVAVRLAGDVAVVTCTENILTAAGDPTPDAPQDGSDAGLAFAGGQVVTTNVYQRTPGGWRLWVHHASPVMGSLEPDDAGQPGAPGSAADGGAGPGPSS